MNTVILPFSIFENSETFNNKSKRSLYVPFPLIVKEFIVFILSIPKRVEGN